MLNLWIILIVLSISFINPSSVFGQNYKRIDQSNFNNSISIYYTFGMSRTYLNREDFGNFGDLVRHMGDEERTRHTYGYSFGYIQKIKTFKRVWLGIGIGFEQKAEVSFPTVYNNPGNPITQISDYFYKLQIQSYQIPVEITFENFFSKHKKSKFKYLIGVNIVPDIYGRYKAYRFLRIRETGEKRVLINGKESHGYDSSHINNFSNHLSNGFLRIGLGVKAGLIFQMNDFVFYGLNIESNYYSNLLKNGEKIVSGRASFTGLRIICGTNF